MAPFSTCDARVLSVLGLGSKLPADKSRGDSDPSCLAPSGLRGVERCRGLTFSLLAPHLPFRDPAPCATVPSVRVSQRAGWLASWELGVQLRAHLGKWAIPSWPVEEATHAQTRGRSQALLLVCLASPVQPSTQR